MLISFSVSNFRSFGKEVTLDMVASTKLTDHTDHLIQIDKTDKHVVRTAMLYRPNAAGKSNLIIAMDFAQSLICTGSQNALTAPDPFRFNQSLTSKPSSFEFRFMVSTEIFVYGFDVARRGVESEWLCALRGSREKVIFERNAKGQTEIGDAPKSFFAGDAEMQYTEVVGDGLESLQSALDIQKAGVSAKKIVVAMDCCYLPSKVSKKYGT